MKFIGYCIFLFIALLLQNCEKNVTISSKQSRSIANELIEKINGNETLSKGVKDFLNVEQNLHNKDLWGKSAFSTNSNPNYAPESNPKFPLPYYLIPATDAKFLYLNEFDPKVRDQLYLLVSGVKYYKLFVHPESEVYYHFLKNAYRYIGENETEFMATPTSLHLSMVVWNKVNKLKTPFIIKTSLDNNTNSDTRHSVNEVEKSISIQKNLNLIGKENLNQMNIKFFSEPAGLIFDRKLNGKPDKFGSQLIREIPREIINGENKWFSLSTLISPNHKPKPLIMEVIRKSGLSSYDFFEKYLINGYLDMYENISLKNGVDFETNSQNLLLETTVSLKPTGKWILRDLGGVWTDQGITTRKNGPLNQRKTLEHQIRGGKSNYFSNYLYFYKKKIFDMLLDEVQKLDSTMTETKSLELKNKIDKLFLTKINGYLKLKLKLVPDISTYKKIEKMILDQATFQNILNKALVKDSIELKAFLEKKKYNQEWIELSSESFGSSEFYITDHGVYEISDNKILGIGLFNQMDLENYKKNNGLMNGILQDFQYQPREGCHKMIKNFF